MTVKDNIPTALSESIHHADKDPSQGLGWNARTNKSNTNDLWCRSCTQNGKDERVDIEVAKYAINHQ